MPRVGGRGRTDRRRGRGERYPRARVEQRAPAPHGRASCTPLVDASAPVTLRERCPGEVPDGTAIDRDLGRGTRSDGEDGSESRGGPGGRLGPTGTAACGRGGRSPARSYRDPGAPRRATRLRAEAPGVGVVVLLGESDPSEVGDLRDQGLADALRGTGTVVEVTGDLGGRKSRLVSELAARSVDTPWTHVRGDPYATRSPYHGAKPAATTAPHPGRCRPRGSR